jgi:hypothetical protein
MARKQSGATGKFPCRMPCPDIRLKWKKAQATAPFLFERKTAGE